MKKITFKDLQKSFNTEKKCINYILENKYKDGTCPICKTKTNFYKVKSLKYHFDTKCKHRFSILADTPLKGIKTQLTTVFHIIFLLSIAKNGLSAKEVQRHFGLTYKAAWALLNKIRQTLANKELLSGDIEMDEAFFGGLESNKHKDKKNINEKGNTKISSNKSTLIGLKSRFNGNVVINAEKNRKKVTINKNIENSIEDLNVLITDEWKAYKSVAIENNLPHLVIEHKYEWYGKKMFDNQTGEIININTNGIEGMWSIVKNSLRNTYKRPSGKFLQSYLDEFSFRFNNRKSDVFIKMLKRSFAI